ncbi:MAG: oligosaccharide flippase family protein [Methanobacteriaceae archaeon]|nr:oligosaccharide flippase family protein [Methanobacteriaceae archaeon]
MSEHKLFIQRIGLVGITNILVALSSLILLPILTKNLSIQDYGIWVQVTVTIGLIPALATLGLPFSMVRFLPVIKDKKEISEYFYSLTGVVLLTSSLVSFLFFLFAGSIGKSLFNGNIFIAKLLPIIIFVACLNYLLINYFRTFNQMKIYSLFLFIQTYLNVILASYLIIWGYGIFGAVIGLLISQIFIFISMFLIIILDIGIMIPRFQKIREHLSFGLPTMPSSMSYWIVDSSDRYIIGIILGTAFVGYYSPGYTLGNLIAMFFFPIATVLTPMISKYYDNNEINEVKRLLKYSLKFFLFLGIPSVFGLYFLSKPILLILTTSEIALNGYIITPIIAISAIFYGLYGIYSQILVVEKKTKIMGVIWIVLAILNISINMILIPVLGILAAGITTLLAYFLAFFFTYLASKKCIKFSLEYKFYLKCIFASICMSSIFILFKPESIINIFLLVILGLVLYVSIFVILKGFEKEEMDFIKRLLK